MKNFKQNLYKGTTQPKYLENHPRDFKLGTPFKCKDAATVLLLNSPIFLNDVNQNFQGEIHQQEIHY